MISTHPHSFKKQPCSLVYCEAFQDLSTLTPFILMSVIVYWQIMGAHSSTNKCISKTELSILRTWVVRALDVVVWFVHSQKCWMPLCTHFKNKLVFHSFPLTCWRKLKITALTGVLLIINYTMFGSAPQAIILYAFCKNTVNFFCRGRSCSVCTVPIKMYCV